MADPVFTTRKIIDDLRSAQAAAQGMSMGAHGCNRYRRASLSLRLSLLFASRAHAHLLTQESDNG